MSCLLGDIALEQQGICVMNPKEMKISPAICNALENCVFCNILANTSSLMIGHHEMLPRGEKYFHGGSLWTLVPSSP